MDQSDVTNLIVESAEKILSDFCDKKLLDQCEAGGFAKELWEEIRSNGFWISEFLKSSTRIKTYLRF